MPEENNGVPMPEKHEAGQNIDGKKNKKSFNLNTFLNFIILIGLIFIYILYFIETRHKQQVAPSTAKLANIPSQAGTKIAFVNTDSLRKKYYLVEDLRTKLTSQYKQLEAEITAKENKLLDKSKSLQNKYELNLISKQEAQRINDEIQIESQNLYELKQQYTDKLSDVEYQMNIDFIDSVYNYLQRLNKEADFNYILGYSKGSNILFARDTFDITEIVVDGLNKEYREKFPEKKK